MKLKTNGRGSRSGKTKLQATTPKPAPDPAAVLMAFDQCLDAKDDLKLTVSLTLDGMSALRLARHAKQTKRSLPETLSDVLCEASERLEGRRF